MGARPSQRQSLNSIARSISSAKSQVFGARKTSYTLSKMRPLVDEDEGEGLVFVHVSCPDDLKAKSTRRTIRRKAMREIGKSRRSRKRPQTWELSLKEPIFEDDGMSTTSSETTVSPYSAQKPIAFDPHNASYYPIELDDRIKRLIQFSMRPWSIQLFMS